MFGTHKLNDRGFDEMKKFKNTMAQAVNEVLSQMNDGREKSLFITHLETAVFNGAKAIASKSENHSEVIEYPL